MRDAGPRVDEEQGLQSYLSLIRLLCGWACLGLGALNLLMGVDEVPYVIFHVVVLAAGVALLGAGVLGRPGRRAGLIAGAVTGAGLLISAVPRTSAAFCCLSDHDKRHGFPFTLLAERSGHWHLDGVRLAADLFFWACVGLFALLTLVAATPGGKPEPAPPPSARHAEPRPETVRDENVRGLP